MVTYKEIKIKQQDDINYSRVRYAFYRHLSSHFTHFFIVNNISPNTITLLSILVTILGFFLLSSGNIILGTLMFMFFHILDCCDGEVARFQKKHGLEGLYLEDVSHYIYAICLGLGLGIGLFSIYHIKIYLYLGFLLTLVFILEYAFTFTLRTIIRKWIIDNRTYFDEEKVLKDFMKYLIQEEWDTKNLMAKMFDFQGLIYSVYFILPITIFLSFIDTFFFVQSLLFYLFWLLIIKILFILLLNKKIICDEKISKYFANVNEKI